MELFSQISARWMAGLAAAPAAALVAALVATGLVAGVLGGMQVVSAPRWLLGRTWGDVSTTLQLENRINPDVVQALREAGHVVEVLADDFSDSMGHAGALVRHPGGVMEGAADPRGDGAVSGV